MNLLTIMGDPQSVNNALVKVLRDNPKMKITAMTACPYSLLQTPSIQLPKPQQALVHALYIAYEGVTDLVDENGRKLDQTKP